MTQTKWMNRTGEHGSGTPIFQITSKSIGEVLSKLRNLEYVYSYEYDDENMSDYFETEHYDILIKPSPDKFHNTPVGNWSNEFYTVREIMDLLYGAYAEYFSAEVRDSEGKMIITYKDTDEVDWNLFCKVICNMPINRKAEFEILKILGENKYIQKSIESTAYFTGAPN